MTQQQEAQPTTTTTTIIETINNNNNKTSPPPHYYTHDDDDNHSSPNILLFCKHCNRLTDFMIEGIIRTINNSLYFLMVCDHCLLYEEQLINNNPFVQH